MMRYFSFAGETWSVEPTGGRSDMSMGVVFRNLLTGEEREGRLNPVGIDRLSDADLSNVLQTTFPKAVNTMMRWIATERGEFARIDWEDVVLIDAEPNWDRASLRMRDGSSERVSHGVFAHAIRRAIVDAPDGWMEILRFPDAMQPNHTRHVRISAITAMQEVDGINTGTAHIPRGLEIRIGDEVAGRAVGEMATRLRDLATASWP